MIENKQTHTLSHALVVGGSNGIGLSVAFNLAARCQRVTVVDKSEPDDVLPANVTFIQADLLANPGPAFWNRFNDADAMVITAGFGRIAPFETFADKEIENLFRVNAEATTRLLRWFYPRLLGTESQQTKDESRKTRDEGKPVFCAVMGSISGLIASPMAAAYSATKAAICRLVEGLNAELEVSGSANRVLVVAPGSVKGTRFNGAPHSDRSQTDALAHAIIDHMLARDTLFIPDYDEVFRGVIERYQTDPHRFALDSARYKQESGRMNLRPRIKVGYLSGTFDLFHIGHLNTLRRAKAMCDYLVVGVHRDASHKGKQAFIPFEERCDIVRSIRYVDEVIPSLPEDDEVWKQGIVRYDMLFVGSDYKGSERFNRYEAFFADKDVRIVYFPYTQGTSSTQLREALDAVKKQS